MKSIIIYISTLCIVLTFVSCGKDSTENKDHLVFRYNESANITSLDPAFSKVINIYGLAITFSMVYSIRRKIKYPTRYCQIWTISPDENLYFYVKRTSIFKSTFYLVTILRTVSLILNTASTDYSMKSRFSRRFYKESFKAKMTAF
jgi:hypothetical protein